jgi:hypothetical protein
MEVPISLDSMGEQHYLILPCEDENEWKRIESVLSRPFNSLSDFDEIINTLSVTDQKCKFFSKIPVCSALHVVVIVYSV